MPRRPLSAEAGGAAIGLFSLSFWKSDCDCDTLWWWWWWWGWGWGWLEWWLQWGSECPWFEHMAREPCFPAWNSLSYWVPCIPVKDLCCIQEQQSERERMHVQASEMWIFNHVSFKTQLEHGWTATRWWFHFLLTHILTPKQWGNWSLRQVSHPTTRQDMVREFAKLAVKGLSCQCGCQGKCCHFFWCRVVLGIREAMAIPI